MANVAKPENKDRNQMRNACPACDDQTATRSIVRQDIPYGAGDNVVMVTADVPVWTCSGCEFQFIDSEGEAAQHEAVCRYLGRLTPSEIKAIRLEAGLSQAMFAEELGKGIATVKRWELGLVIQTADADQRIRAFAQSRRARARFEPRFRTQLSAAVLDAATRFQLRGGTPQQLAA